MALLTLPGLFCFAECSCAINVANEPFHRLTRKSELGFRLSPAAWPQKSCERGSARLDFVPLTQAAHLQRCPYRTVSRSSSREHRHDWLGILYLAALAIVLEAMY